MPSPNEVKLVLEAALLSSQCPLSLPDLGRLFSEEIGADTLRRLLEEIKDGWNERGVELVNLATGWRFQTRPQYQPYLERLSEDKAPKYSRAVMETLAIIAYRQPVSRGDIEDIRGVVVSQNVIRTLEDRGWIDVVGHRETPGRPALYATTKAFLDDLGLRSLQELPPLEEIAKNADLIPRPVASNDASPAGGNGASDQTLEGGAQPTTAADDAGNGPDHGADGAPNEAASSEDQPSSGNRDDGNDAGDADSTGSAPVAAQAA